MEASPAHRLFTLSKPIGENIAIPVHYDDIDFAEKANPQESERAFATYEAYVDRSMKIANLRYVGPHAEFKYWGMAETAHSAQQKSQRFEPV